MMLCELGLALIYANISSFAMSTIHDKSHGSAVMSFINMGLTTVVVLSITNMSTTLLLMPSLYICISLVMLGLYFFIKTLKPTNDSGNA